MRDYGYGDSPDTLGPPKVVEKVDKGVCPHCECTSVFLMEVEVVAPPLLRKPKGTKAFSVYTGCPACPWASPAMITARKSA